MADMSIDVIKANEWVKNVRAEIAEVNVTLKKVDEVCNTFPGEDDTIIQLVEKTGSMLNDAWNKACDTYKNAWEELERGIADMGRTGQEVAEKFEGFVSKYIK